MLRILPSLMRQIRSYRHKRMVRILIKQGLTIGYNTTIMEGVYFDPPHSFLISIGNNCSINRHVRFMAHDATSMRYLGFSKLGKIHVLDNCVIGERAIILPGVTIGPNSIVAAGSFVNKHVPPGKMVAGSPARVYANTDDYLAQKALQQKARKTFLYDTFYSSLTPSFKAEVQQLLEKDPILFVEGTGMRTVGYGGITNQRAFRHHMNLTRQRIAKLLTSKEQDTDNCQDRPDD